MTALVSAVAVIVGVQRKADLGMPLDIPAVLSANFGELRPNHFHSGLDFKTRGVTGLDVLAVADGYIAAVEVEPGGFGRAVVVRHPALGLTSVYGHLEGFVGEVDSVVTEEHYRSERFTLWLDFAPFRFPVKRGDVIGKSGNAGYSGGPHLHFDVRSLLGLMAYDPLEYYRDKVRDTRGPAVSGLYLYHGDMSSTAFGAGDVVEAWGDVFPAIEAVDSMDGTGNHYGVKHLLLKIDGRPVWGRTIDGFAMADTRAVNTLVDYDRYCRERRWIQWTRIAASRPLATMVGALPGNGAVRIDRERDYAAEWILQDEHGNRRTVRFTIRGRRGAARTTGAAKGTLMRWDGENSWRNATARVVIPARAAYDDFRLEVRVDSGRAVKGGVGPVLSLGPRAVAMRRPMRLEMAVPAGMSADDAKLCVARVWGDVARGVATRREDGRLVADVYDMGDYTVARDDTAPTIEREATATGDISFIVKDNLSGIADWRGTIDGRWALMEYDAKNDRIWYRLDGKRFKRGVAHEVELTVVDGCGNRRTVKTRL